MRGFSAAIFTEAIKAWKSKMLWITMILFVFAAVMMGFLMIVSKHPEIAGNSAVLSAKASFAGSATWPSFFSLLIQMALVLGMLGPGMVTIWIFGREYSDRVVKDLLALPVSREMIVISKFLIILIWSIFLLFLLYTFGILSGLAAGLDGWSADALLKFSEAFAGSSLLTILLCTPIAYITSVSRGYLLPVGLLIILLIITQFIFVGLPGITPYFPWAVPALYSRITGPLNPEPKLISYLILILTSLTGFYGTIFWWQYADQH
jgi:ABC-2 type transport system permease protein